MSAAMSRETGTGRIKKALEMAFKRQKGPFAWLMALGVTALGGCSPISIEPSCPNTLRVGESGPVSSNVVNPGGIPTYFWEAFPDGAGTFASATSPDTDFTPAIEGDVVIRLTAADGFYQVVSQCVISVEGTLGPTVTFSAAPQAALVGEPVALTCESTGSDPIGIFSVVQTSGGDVALTDGTEPGTATFTPTEIGDLTFRCVGETDNGLQSEAAFLVVTVNQNPSPDDGTGDDTGDDGSGDDGGRAGGGRI
ncbi:MAG: hypothetical protein ACPGXK_13170 [Phycisphaerae bacterium]